MKQIFGIFFCIVFCCSLNGQNELDRVRKMFSKPNAYVPVQIWKGHLYESHPVEFFIGERNGEVFGYYRIISSGSDFILEGEGSQYKNAFLEKPNLTERMIINSYNTVRKKLISVKSFDLNVLEEYFTIKPVSVILNELILDYVKDQETNQAIKVFGKEYNKNLKAKVKNLIQDQIDFTKQKLINIIDPGFKIPKETVSNRSIPTTLVEWYGQYYKELKE